MYKSPPYQSKMVTIHIWRGTLMKTGTLKQILLITDGCSNQGDDPIAMAALAKEQGITVNVIGVMEQDVIDEQGYKRN